MKDWYFIEWDDESRVKRAGKIIKQVTEDIYMLEYLSFLTNDFSTGMCMLKNMSSLTLKELYTFYEDEETFINNYNVEKRNKREVR